MSRISSSTFKVNNQLQQEMELSSVAVGVTVPISTDGSTLDVDIVNDSVGLATSINQSTACFFSKYRF